MKITVAEPALVLLVGPAGSGKSTFAQTYFRPSEIVSSDAMREKLSDDEADQGASAEAFQVLAIIINGRLRRRLTTVVDATNLRAPSRRRYQRLASRYGIPTVAVCFDLPPATYRRRNSGRPERVVPDAVVREQVDQMKSALANMKEEGYAALHVVTDEPVEVVRG
jgi:predicted kinase